MDKKKIPVLIGQAQITCREKTEKQIDPLQMMAEASHKAFEDAALLHKPDIDTLYIVNCLSKILQSPCKDLSAILGIGPAQTGYTAVGGYAPQWFVNQAAEKIFTGNSEIVLICGAESFYTKEKLHHFGKPLSHFINSDYETAKATYIGDIRKPNTDLELHYGLKLPIYVYSLFENALRAHWKKPLHDHIEEIASFCAGFSNIASQNRFSWTKEAFTAEEIASISDDNQMVVYPYTKRMCANMTVNQAAAVIMTSWAKAEELGVSEEKIIYLCGCGDAEDVYFVSQRPDLWATPSVADAADMALKQVPLSMDDIKYFELYSCFPCVPRIVREMLKIKPNDPRPLTVTGGLPYFGGPGNNYCLHSICNMAERLRDDPGSFGLVHTTSWFLNKHSIGIYSAKPGKNSWKPHDHDTKQKKYPSVNVIKEANTKGKIESYTLAYDNNGQPYAAIVIGRNKTDDRFIAKVKDENNAILQMTKEEPIGKTGDVRHDAKTSTNWFYFD